MARPRSVSSGCISFLESESVPVRLALSANEGRTLVADRHLPPAALALACPAVSRVLVGDSLTKRCHTCFERLPASSFSCSACGRSHYCSQVCREADAEVHALQCRTLPSVPDGNMATGPRRLASSIGYDVSGTVRLTLAALAHEIHRSRRSILDVGKGKDVQNSPLTYEWGLRDILNLQYARPRDTSWIPSAVDSLYLGMDAMLNLEGQLPCGDNPARLSPWDKPSLEHLLLCVAGNAHPVIEPSTQSVIGCMISPLAALVNHSSHPNVVLYSPTAMDRLLMRTVRPIRKGESLSYAYVDTYVNPMERLTLLAEGFGFVDRTALADKTRVPPGREGVARVSREEVQYGSLPSLAAALTCPRGCPGPAVPGLVARDESRTSPAVEMVSRLSRSRSWRALCALLPKDVTEAPRVARTCLACRASSDAQPASFGSQTPSASRIVRSLARSWQAEASRADPHARLAGVRAIVAQPVCALLHPLHRLWQDMDTSLLIAAREIGDVPLALEAVERAVVRLQAVTPAALDRVALLRRQQATLAAQPIVSALRRGVTPSDKRRRYVMCVVGDALRTAEEAFGEAPAREDRQHDDGRDHTVPAELFALYSRMKMLKSR